jgi:hypothetical protein
VLSIYRKHRYLLEKLKSLHRARLEMSWGWDEETLTDIEEQICKELDGAPLTVKFLFKKYKEELREIATRYDTE